MITKLKTSAQRAYIAKRALDGLVKAGEESSSDAEICHALLGKEEGDSLSITDHQALTNVAKNPLHLYTPHPEEFIKLVKSLNPFDKSTDKKLLGFYHTHPLNQAFPSLKDIQGTGYKGIYLIHSPLYKEFHSFWVPGKGQNWKFLNLKTI